MNIIRRRGWEISDRLATPEHLAFSRRSLLAGVQCSHWRPVRLMRSA